MVTVLSRRRFLRTLAGVSTAGLTAGQRAHAAGANETVVEDWSAQTPGAHGIPAGWKPYETPGGHPAYDFTIVDDGGHRGLSLRSRDDHSTIARRISVNLAETPVLQWDWKVVELPRGADLRQKATSDATGHPLLVWPRPPAILRSRLIAYVWDLTLPPDTIVKSAKAGAVYFIVVRSGAGELGTWKTERRDVRADYRRAFAEDAPDPEVLALSIDTNDTRAPAACIVGRIAFTPSGPAG